MTGTGHVFVIQGRLENVDYDAVVVSTDRRFVVEPTWSEVLGQRGSAWDTRQLQPERWSDRRYGAAAQQPPSMIPTWFIDAAIEHGEDPGEALAGLASRLGEVLGEIDAADVAPGRERARPLVALPTLGTGGGGFGAIRGRVIDALLTACEDAVASAGIDVVIVASSVANYSAFQQRRRGLLTQGRAAPERLEAARRLARQARSGDLALFIGAGVGMSAGLPSWEALLAHLSTEAGLDVGELRSDLDKAEVLSKRLGADFGQKVAALVRGTRRYGLAHAMLAALGCREVVTTNYDDLYERAARDVPSGHGIATLPFDHATADAPWILKMHGDARLPDRIVLTRSDFVRYDANSRPLGSIVQSLMATKHLLVVGASMTDDNFLRLAHEVFAFQEAAVLEGSDSPVHRPIGTVVALRDTPVKAMLWEDRFDYLPTSSASETADQARDLAIFLDLVAMHACEDAHLLDARYEDLLGSDQARAAAATARELLSQVVGLPGDVTGAWRTLEGALRALGAGERE